MTIELHRIPIPKEQANADISIFENYIPSIKAEKGCRYCFGRGYTGFGAVPNGDHWLVKLTLCRCVTVGRTDYTLLKEQLDHNMGFVYEKLKEEIQANRRRTFFGGIEWAFKTLWKKWVNRGNPKFLKKITEEQVNV
jgi:hypothetical protein